MSSLPSIATESSTVSNAPSSGSATRSSDYPIAPVPFNDVKLTEGFWRPKVKVLKDTTIPFALEKTRPAVENLRRCGAFLRGEQTELPFTHRFVTSDLYKVMEGAAFMLTLEEDPELEAEMDRIIDIIAAAQQEDGYLYVSHICGVARPEEMGETPYSFVVHSHELYNVGHLYEGAVAYFQATGKRTWLDVAEKSAQHVNRVFFEGDPAYNNGKPINQAPGHQEPELALCKLYRATGNPLYLDMAKRFLDIRGVTYRPEGEGTMDPEYAQQHLPVAQQDRAVGHAVRAGYLYAGMADVSALTGDVSYMDALDRIWLNIVNDKMHLTGGLGAVHGIEGFGDDFDLPNLEAYNESCAAIANVFFNHRMFLLHGEAKYFDVAEIALLNNSLAGVNLNGNRFFYVNPLEADGRNLFNHGLAGRSPWFDCACCPSNIARLVPQVSGYMYAVENNALYALLYAANEATLDIADTRVQLTQKTLYPYDGAIELCVTPDKSTSFELRLRIPTWAGERFVPGSLYEYVDPACSGWRLTVNGEAVEPALNKGFACLTRSWQPGDKVLLQLSMPVRYSTCDERVEANRGRLAVTRGPLVYCAEETDHNGPVQRLFLTDDTRLSKGTLDTIESGALAGMPRISLPAGEVAGDREEATTLQLVPYFAWNNRGNASMNVWFPNHKDAATTAMQRNLFDASIFGDVAASSHNEEDLPESAISGDRPQSSDQSDFPRWSSSADEAEKPWLQMVFNHPQTIERVALFWAEEMETDLAVPASWSMEVLMNGQWKPFEPYITCFYGCKANTYNVMYPAAVQAIEGLRILITPQDGKRIGIMDIDLTTAN